MPPWLLEPMGTWRIHDMEVMRMFSRAQPDSVSEAFLHAKAEDLHIPSLQNNIHVDTGALPV
jgi:hypothetical protein